MLLLLGQSDVVAGQVLFWTLALMTAASALSVAATRNIVRMAVGLLFTLMGVAGLYFMLAAEFLAAVQLVVYAGGTLILIIFGVMLTNRSPFVKMQPSRGEVMGAVVIGAVLMVSLSWAVLKGAWTAGTALAPGNYPLDKLGVALLGDYLVPFEAVSVLLLIVMIGAAYLAKARRRRES